MDRRGFLQSLGALALSTLAKVPAPRLPVGDPMRIACERSYWYIKNALGKKIEPFEWVMRPSVAIVPPWLYLKLENLGLVPPTPEPPK